MQTVTIVIEHVLFSKYLDSGEKFEKFVIHLLTCFGCDRSTRERKCHANHNWIFRSSAFVKSYYYISIFNLCLRPRALMYHRPSTENIVK